MDIKTSQDILEIRDLAVASFLYCTPSIRFIGKQRLPNGTVIFQFSPRQEAEVLVSQYWSLSAPTVQPKQLFTSLRDLKDLIFAG
jgi:hypothetical protein